VDKEEIVKYIYISILEGLSLVTLYCHQPTVEGRSKKKVLKKICNRVDEELIGKT